MPANNSSIDPKSGFNSVTKTFHSLRPPVPIPSPEDQISITQYVFSLSSSNATSLPPDKTPFLIDSVTGKRLMYSQFFEQVENLASSLRLQFPLSVLRKGDTAFILVTPSFSVPVLYFALLSLGVVISPANTLSSESEIAHQIELTKPVIAFATSSTAHKIPVLKLGTILLDSPEFQSRIDNRSVGKVERVSVNQSDSAAILYSSGTTGRVKGVLLTHRNLIALIAGYFHLQPEKDENAPHPVSLFMLPLFHVFGFFMMVRAVATGDTLVLMEKFDLEKMLKAIEEHKITYIPVSPPLIVALTKSDLVKKYDLSSLMLLGCGGASLGKEVADKFLQRFPHVEIGQGYGLTETSGGITRTIGLDEANRYGSVGRIAENMEAKIVDPSTGEALPPGQRGELWLRGPTIMKGYVGNDAATAATLDSEGWLKTGDLCYFDSDGFLYIVDRLKELIKYKAYQVPPAELEHLLQSNPEIADAAVVPYPDEVAGEIPMAYVVRKPGSSINEAQVMDYIAKLVAPYKKVRRVAFINAIPKSPAGKILRRELVNLAVGPSSKL